MSRGRAGGSEGAYELKRVEHLTGGMFGPRGGNSGGARTEQSLLPEPDEDETGEDSYDESKPEPD